MTTTEKRLAEIRAILKLYGGKDIVLKNLIDWIKARGETRIPFSVEFQGPHDSIDESYFRVRLNDATLMVSADRLAELERVIREALGAHRKNDDLVSRLVARLQDWGIESHTARDYIENDWCNFLRDVGVSAPTVAEMGSAELEPLAARVVARLLAGEVQEKIDHEEVEF